MNFRQWILSSKKINDIKFVIETNDSIAKTIWILIKHCQKKRDSLFIWDTYLILLRNRYYSTALYRTLSNRLLGSSFEEVYKNRFVSLYEYLNKYYFEQKRLRILIKILWFINSDKRTLNDKNLDQNIIEPYPLDAVKSKILFSW